jgi:DnaD/phage-associated family protein
MGKVIYRRHTMDIPNYYAIIPAKIRYDKELMANAKLLYGEITALCNDKGICWARNEYFADLYDVSNETISRWISQLNKKKYIKVKMFYKKDSKEIDKRIISINQYPIDENVNTYCQENQSNTLLTKTSIPYIQKNQGGIDKNIKENITSINNKKEEERNFQSELKDVIEFYENNITLITSFISEDMEKYLKSGLYADLIIEAMKEAVSRNKRNWKYVTGILNDCINNKLYTAKQFKIRQEEFKSNKTQTHQSNKTKEKIEYKEVELTEEQYNKMMNERGKKYE